jgi:hypothetical protein
MGFPHGGHDAFEVLAAVDIPVEDPCAGAGRDCCGIASGVDISSGSTGGESAAPVKAIVSARMEGPERNIKPLAPVFQGWPGNANASGFVLY